jgi:hypothetical protein
VLQTILDDHNNPLVKYAAKNSTTAKSSDASSESEKSKERPLYLLGEKIITTSTSEDKRTLTCREARSLRPSATRKLQKRSSSPFNNRRMARYPFRSILSSFEPLPRASFTRDTNRRRQRSWFSDAYKNEDHGA